ncbi:hypothetical protein G6F61_013060 [Rhizopus arrhizus]|nr:hypothetical protein G6F61_013060 [Rhizopus arrhizus]
MKFFVPWAGVSWGWVYHILRLHYGNVRIAGRTYSNTCCLRSDSAYGSVFRKTVDHSSTGSILVIGLEKPICMTLVLEADLMERGVYLFVSIPASFMSVLIQLATVIGLIDVVCFRSSSRPTSDLGRHISYIKSSITSAITKRRTNRCIGIKKAISQDDNAMQINDSSSINLHDLEFSFNITPYVLVEKSLFSEKLTALLSDSEDEVVVDNLNEIDSDEEYNL